ncbi:MAG: hypothetical protein ABIK83_04845 [Candidatus Zixiibacteriota bacterium]
MRKSSVFDFSLNSMKLPGAILALLLAIILGMGGCSIEKPQSPTWDTEFVVPLMSHNYDMLELVDRIAEDNLAYDSLGNISFSVEQNLDTVAIDAGLAIDDLSDEFSESLGLIEISAPSPVTEHILLEDYIPLVLGEVPAISVSATKSLPIVSDVESATIESGSMIVSATNDFGIPLDSVSIGILDMTSLEVLGTVTFEDGLGMGETRSRSIDLSGKTIWNSFYFGASLHSPGGTLFSVGENRVTITVGFSNTITVSSATAKIPAQEKSYSQEISFSEENIITSAEVRSGDVELTVTNNTNLAADIEIVISQFTDDGNPLSIPASLLPSQTSIISADLSGYDFTPIDGRPEPTVEFTTNVSLAGSGVVTAYVSSDNNFGVEVNVSNIAFRSVSGIINPTVIEIEPITESVDIPNGFENFSLTSAVMEISIQSAVNLPGEIEIHLESGAGQELDVVGTIAPGSVEMPITSTIIVDDLSAFLNPIPTEITVSGYAIVGDGATEGGVTENDFVFGTVTITSPLEMTIGETEFETDISEADLNDISSEDVDRLNNGSAVVHISNHLPLAATLTLHLAGDSTSLWDNPELTIGPIEVASGEVGTSGLVIKAIGSDVTIALNHDDLSILDNSILYVGEVITFPGTNGQAVRIISSDFIDIEAYITINARIGDF